eukprot:GILK01005282.1.p1 GENE.GILK01005282.1~~GILK01005282.1.p1  ORF type:complete len:827 (-),score=87.91 GILK01005282.1:106-2586(-)
MVRRSLLLPLLCVFVACLVQHTSASVCSTYVSAETCVVIPECGWCVTGGTGSCVQGSVDGPTQAGNKCEVWDKYGCITASDVDSCVVQQFPNNITCGWCGAKAAGRCLPGTVEGPKPLSACTRNSTNFWDRLGCTSATSSKQCIEKNMACGWCGSAGKGDVGTCLMATAQGGDPSRANECPNTDLAAAKRAGANVWDPFGCTSATDASACSELSLPDHNCGWCLSFVFTSMCLPGTRKTPANHWCNVTTEVWDSEGCSSQGSAEDCNAYSTNQPHYCGWCNSNKLGKRCMPGNPQGSFPLSLCDGTWDGPTQGGPPSISTVTPTVVNSNGGTYVTIVGPSLGLEKSDVRVTIANNECDVVSFTIVNSTRTEVVIRNRAAKNYGDRNALVLETLGGSTPRNTLFVGTSSCPVVEGLAPNSVDLPGRVMLTLTGQGFQSAPITFLKIANVTCDQIKVNSDSNLTCIIGSSTVLVSNGPIEMQSGSCAASANPGVGLSFVRITPAPPRPYVKLLSNTSVLVRIDLSDLPSASANKKVILNYALMPVKEPIVTVEQNVTADRTVYEFFLEKLSAADYTFRGQACNEQGCGLLGETVPSSVHVMEPRCDRGCSQRGVCRGVWLANDMQFTGQCTCREIFTGPSCNLTAPLTCKPVVPSADLAFCGKMKWPINSEMNWTAADLSANSIWNDHQPPADKCDPIKYRQYICMRNGFKMCNDTTIRGICRSACQQVAPCSSSLDVIDCESALTQRCTTFDGLVEYDSTYNPDQPDNPDDKPQKRGDGDEDHSSQIAIAVCSSLGAIFVIGGVVYWYKHKSSSGGSRRRAGYRSFA